jgi:hypothetical protein
MGRIRQMEISAFEYLSTNIPMHDFADITFQHFLLYNEHQYSVALAVMSNDDDIEPFGQKVEM